LEGAVTAFLGFIAFPYVEESSLVSQPLCGQGMYAEEDVTPPVSLMNRIPSEDEEDRPLAVSHTNQWFCSFSKKSGPPYFLIQTSEKASISLFDT
jgi:hypothetical protein